MPGSRRNKQPDDGENGDRRETAEEAFANIARSAAQAVFAARGRRRTRAQAERERTDLTSSSSEFRETSPSLPPSSRRRVESETDSAETRAQEGSAQSRQNRSEGDIFSPNPDRLSTTSSGNYDPTATQVTEAFENPRRREVITPRAARLRRSAEREGERAERAASAEGLRRVSNSPRWRQRRGGTATVITISNESSPVRRRARSGERGDPFSRAHGREKSRQPIPPRRSHGLAFRPREGTDASVPSVDLDARRRRSRLPTASSHGTLSEIEGVAAEVSRLSDSGAQIVADAIERENMTTYTLPTDVEAEQQTRNTGVPTIEVTETGDEQAWRNEEWPEDIPAGNQLSRTPNSQSTTLPRSRGASKEDEEILHPGGLAGPPGYTPGVRLGGRALGPIGSGRRIGLGVPESAHPNEAEDPHDRTDRTASDTQTSTHISRPTNNQEQSGATDPAPHARENLPSNSERTSRSEATDRVRGVGPADPRTAHMREIAGRGEHRGGIFPAGTAHDEVMRLITAHARGDQEQYDAILRAQSQAARASENIPRGNFQRSTPRQVEEWDDRDLSEEGRGDRREPPRRTARGHMGGPHRNDPDPPRRPPRREDRGGGGGDPPPGRGGGGGGDPPDGNGDDGYSERNPSSRGSAERDRPRGRSPHAARVVRGMLRVLQQIDDRCEATEHTILRNMETAGNASSVKVLADFLSTQQTKLIQIVDDLNYEEATEQELELVNVQSRAFLRRVQDRLGAADAYIKRDTAGAQKQVSHGKLPELPMPTFDGKVDKYHEFASKFDSTIERRTDLDDQAKLSYLVMNCTGEARSFLRRYTQGEGVAKYADVRKALDERFGNQQMITETLMKQLQESRPKAEDYQAQRDFIDRVTSYVHALEANGVTFDTASAAGLITTLKGRIKHEIALQWHRYLKLKDLKTPTLKQFLQFVEEELENYALTDHTRQVVRKSEGKPTSTNYERRGGQEGSYPSGSRRARRGRYAPRGANVLTVVAAPEEGLANGQAVALVGPAMNGPKNGPRKRNRDKRRGENNQRRTAPPGPNKRCAFCGNEHASIDCVKAKAWTPVQRVDKLLGEGNPGCSRCLNPAHTYRQCQQRKRECGVDGCTRLHHRLLHGGFKAPQNNRKR